MATINPEALNLALNEVLRRETYKERLEAVTEQYELARWYPKKSGQLVSADVITRKRSRNTSKHAEEATAVALFAMTRTAPNRDEVVTPTDRYVGVLSELGTFVFLSHLTALHRARYHNHQIVGSKLSEFMWSTDATGTPLPAPGFPVDKNGKANDRTSQQFQLRLNQLVGPARNSSDFFWKTLEEEVIFFEFSYVPEAKAILMVATDFTHPEKIKRKLRNRLANPKES